MRSLRKLLLPMTLAVQLPAQTRAEFTEVHMGLAVRIVLFAPDEAIARRAARAAFARIGELDDALSNYRPQSEVRQLETHIGTWSPSSTALFDVLSLALEIARLSDGAFDPTVGPLTELWREARQTGRLPPQATLDSARAAVGWKLVELDSVRRSVRLTRPGMRLDFGGIAKGYVLQRAVDVLRAQGTPNALVEAGGDLVVGDAPPNAAGWKIDARFGDARIRAVAATLTNAALSTSGSTEQFIEIGGVRYSHVVDPRTGLGVAHSRVVTVIATDAALADALATAAGVLDPSRALHLASRFPAVILSADAREMRGVR